MMNWSIQHLLSFAWHLIDCHTCVIFVAFMAARAYLNSTEDQYRKSIQSVQLEQFRCMRKHHGENLLKGTNQGAVIVQSVDVILSGLKFDF